MSDEEIRELVDDAPEFDPNDDAGQRSPRGQLVNGSDVEIAGCIADDLSAELGELVFCEGSFWYYDKTHWKTIASYKLELAVQKYDGMVFRTQANSTSVVKLNDTRIRSIIKCMAPSLTRPDFFSQAPDGINCASGFIRFASDGKSTLKPHDPNHRCRHMLQGRWTRPTCPLDLRGRLAFSRLGGLLQGVFRGDPDAEQKVALLQEIAGAAAIGYGTRLRQPKAVILKGETAENGKSQVLDLFRSLLPGEATASIPAAKMADEHFIPRLVGVHLNAADELSGATAIASDTFKAVITGEPVAGRDVYKSAVTFRSVAQHVFCTNALPSFSGGIDRGVQRRLLVVPFNRVIPKEERIENIGRRIGEEEPDLLLAWAVDGASRLIRQRDFTVPPSSEAALHEWLYTADPVLAWVRACITIVSREAAEWGQAKIKSREGYDHFASWAKAEHHLERTLPAINSFIQRLRANYPSVQLKHTNKGNWLVGLRMNPDTAEPDCDPTSTPFGLT